jgi:threonine/homoserine/homoserine lactone efflux protein
MTEIIWHFLVGMIVSFIGSIPLGSINLSTLQISLEKTARAAFIFALGATIVELVYSFIAIQFSAYLLQNKSLETYIQLVAIPAFIGLSIHSFMKKEKEKNQGVQTHVNDQGYFWKGVLIGLINPLQIPFWVAYGTYMLTNDWIKNDNFLLNFFVLGIVTGTYLLLSFVIVLSKKLENRLNLGRFNMNKAIGGVFLALAIYQMVKLII